MKIEILTPDKLTKEVSKLIEANIENVDLIINGIHEGIVTQKAQYPNGFLKKGVITLQGHDIRRPNKNWHIQSITAANLALKEFRKYWKVKRIGKWDEESCHVEFTPKKNLKTT